jgi:hypothetical protein
MMQNNKISVARTRTQQDVLNKFEQFKRFVTANNRCQCTRDLTTVPTQHDSANYIGKTLKTLLCYN